MRSRKPLFQYIIPQEQRFVKEKMSLWLAGFKWDAVGTFTFRRTHGIYGAKCCFEKFCKPVARDCFYAVERFFLTPGVHIHALIKYHDLYFGIMREMWRGWYRKYGAAKITPYRAFGGAEKYCSKYITKQLCDWDMWGFPDDGVDGKFFT